MGAGEGSVAEGPEVAVAKERKLDDRLFEDNLRGGKCMHRIRDPETAIIEGVK